MGDDKPFEMNQGNALAIVREIAADTSNIFLLGHAKIRGKQRAINRGQVVACVQKGTLVEGPFLNAHACWQMTLYRHAAGEQMNCVIAVELPSRIIVVTVF